MLKLQLASLVVLELQLAALVVGHGMLVHPPSRNAVDRTLEEFANGAWPAQTDGCNCADSRGGCHAASARASGGGQACLWFSQGCAIGCPSCTNLHGHTNVSLCEHPTATATLNSPALRTMNVDAPPGTERDVYRFNPWRAPGTAPVADSCGMAGGSPHPVRQDAALFYNTEFARQGDLGSKVLAPAPSGTVWARGSAQEVAWAIRYNHGGGYAYRLCPAGQPLTEACFQRTHLGFVGRPSLRWNDGKELHFNGTYVSEGTHPPNSMWARNPIPRINDSPEDSGSPAPYNHSACRDPAVGGGCRQFEEVCESASPPWWPIEPTARKGDIEGMCSGDWTGGVIVDRVRIPATLPAGEYVLSWRWDCEETAQIWAACADVTIS